MFIAPDAHTDTVHKCNLSSQAKNYQGTLVPLQYKQPLPTHPFLKVQLYIVVKCRNIYRVTNNDYRKKISHNAPVTRQYF